VKTYAGLLAGAIVFLVLATANSGGYRYGVSDQAYYLPAVALAGDPDLFPRDRVVLATQTGLMAADDALAWASRATGLDLPEIFLGTYILTVLILYGATIGLARTLGLNWWATSAALLVITLRHRISKTGANSLEGYMHPRQLAFGLGVLAWVCLLRRRPAWAVAVTALSALVHPTTALWFAASIAVAFALGTPHRRARLITASLVAGAAALWALTLGPLAGRWVVMDEAWLSVLADKDYLFPGAWPIYAWVTNLGYAVVIGSIYRARRRADALVPGEDVLVAGLAALVVGFLVSVPLTEARLALVVQLQVNRVFWLLDFVVALYLAWWVTGAGRNGRRRLAAAVVGLLALIAAGRGTYLLTVTHAERSLVERDFTAGPWSEAMRWLADQPPTWHVLADPGHGWKYGTSVRAAALRDTVLESGKDTAMAMYDRAVAMRVRDRIMALSGFETFSTEDVRAVDAAYDLDVAVLSVSQPLDLPVLYRNDGFAVYDLR